MVNIPGEDAYAVRIGAGVLSDLGRSMRAIESLSEASEVLVITDDQVAPRYLAQAKMSLSRAGYHASDICLPSGEQAKSIDVLAEVWEAMASLSLQRDCVVVALGGGVVGDLAGFAAATYMRGVEVVQAPTTLLAMVDSSVGGKTGVNLQAGKNLVGAFKQPTFVCADTVTLETLPPREWACGCGEIAKSAVIEGTISSFGSPSMLPSLRRANRPWSRRPSLAAWCSRPTWWRRTRRKAAACAKA